MNQVELVGVSKIYGDQHALDDVSVGFSKEKITVIVGRSGSGKSTLLKSINGLTKPSSGTVLLSGQPLDYKNIILSRRRIGYMVQGNGLFPHLSVKDNISIPGRIAGAVDDTRTIELLKFVDLPQSYLDKYPSELSGGEQQRVALCRALYLNPPVLLMDEPFASLDTYTRRDLQSKLLELRDAFKLTMVIVTHDIPEAIRLADDILLLERGRVQAFGPGNLIVKELPA